MNNSVGEDGQTGGDGEGFHWEWHALPHTFCGGSKLASEFIMWLPLLRFKSLVKTLWGVNVNKGTLFQKEMAL